LGFEAMAVLHRCVVETARKVTWFEDVVIGYIFGIHMGPCKKHW
jgi:hypothetical protein